MSAQYPGAAGTDANLFVAVNNLSTSLTDNPLTSGATTVNVASTTGFPTAGYITIEAEAISYTGTTSTSFTGCTRGADGTTGVSHLTGLTVFHDAVAAHHNVLKDEIKAVEGDLVSTFSALTPATPSSTATSLLNRVNQMAKQLINIAGTTNWYDAIAVPLSIVLPLAGGTMSGAIAMASHKITGLANGSAAQDAAAFGQLKVIQTISATGATNSGVSASSFTTTVVTATITPTSSSNRIKIEWSAIASIAAVDTVTADIFLGAGSVDSSAGVSTYKSSTAAASQSTMGSVYVHSPASTSALVYTIFVKTSAASTVNFGNGNTWSIVLTEIV